MWFVGRHFESESYSILNQIFSHCFEHTLIILDYYQLLIRQLSKALIPSTWICLFSTVKKGLFPFYLYKCGFLFYSVAYQLLLLLFIWCSNFPRFYQRDFLQIDLCLESYRHSFGFLKNFLLSSTIKYSKQRRVVMLRATQEWTSNETLLCSTGNCLVTYDGAW